jgi:hypothetical protein
MTRTGARRREEALAVEAARTHGDGRVVLGRGLLSARDAEAPHAARAWVSVGAGTDERRPRWRESAN